jgi:hypothetical protein
VVSWERLVSDLWGQDSPAGTFLVNSFGKPTRPVSRGLRPDGRIAVRVLGIASALLSAAGLRGRYGGAPAPIR